MSEVYICRPVTFAARRILPCKTCRKKCRVAQLIGFDLDLLYCCGCGGDPRSRSRFKKITWERRQRIDHARELWERATDFKTAVCQAADYIMNDMF